MLGIINIGGNLGPCLDLCFFFVFLFLFLTEWYKREEEKKCLSRGQRFWPNFSNLTIHNKRPPPSL